MKNLPKILFYCQHSLGMGHLVRSLALAESLAQSFQITLLNGGRFPKKLRVPESLKIVNLPPLAFGQNNQLISCDKRRSVERAKILRKKIIIENFHALKPEIVLVELFPFGRKKFAGELVPLLEVAQGKAKIVCSLRDILVGSRRDQERFEQKAIALANEFFDAVLIHSDEKFARFEDSLKTNLKLKIPRIYTGFVVPNAQKQTRRNLKTATKKIIVSAGGGIVGETLLRTSIAAHKLLSQTEKIETKIVAGLFLPEEIFQKLKIETRQIKNLKLIRFEKNLRGAMAESDVSVSQCGYNTAFDILLSGVSGIVVPYDENGEDEQMIRARKLEKLNALKVLSSKELATESLSKAIKKSFTFQPSAFSLDINGGANSVKILRNLLPNIQAKVHEKKYWLEPVRAVLESGGDRQIKIFFRNDDAGISDQRLFGLLDLFEKYRMPLDLAVIPKAVTKDFAEKLTARIGKANGLFSIHQHGFSHTNHEREGRKCEFGLARPQAAQFRDISEGKQILRKYFGALAQPIFTPPWNRCSAATAEVLRELDFQILSRESKAEILENSKIAELPVAIDWFAKRKGVLLEKPEIGAMIADKIAEEKAFGIMLHHAEMDEKEFGYLEELCKLFAEFPRVKFVSMLDLASENQPSFAVHSA
jgi:predicted glycosyltransferase